MGISIFNELGILGIVWSGGSMNILVHMYMYNTQYGYIPDI